MSADPPPKRQRSEKAVTVNSHCRRSVNDMMQFIAARGDAELDLRPIKSFQQDIGRKLQNLMAMEVNTHAKEAMRKEFEWMTSDEFVEFFQEKYREIKAFHGSSREIKAFHGSSRRGDVM